MGHAIRSRVVINELIKDWEVRVCTGGRPFEVLNNHFSGMVHEIVGTGLAYRENCLRIRGTVVENVKRIPSAIKRNSHELKSFFEYDPDVVITDFESLVSLFSDISGKPLISIDNMQLMARCSLDIENEDKILFELTRKLVANRVPRADHYIITSFFPAQPKSEYRDQVSIAPPIIRPEIINTRISPGEHVLVYHTSGSDLRLLEVLTEASQACGLEFRVYGFPKEKAPLLKLKNFSEEEFVSDLTSCRAIIAGGGFTLMSEAIYLKKPIMSIPLEKHIEQIVNARYLKQFGYGEFHPPTTPLTSQAIIDFLSLVPHLEENLSGYQQEGNEEFFNCLKKRIGAIS